MKELKQINIAGNTTYNENLHRTFLHHIERIETFVFDLIIDYLTKDLFLSLSLALKLYLQIDRISMESGSESFRKGRSLYPPVMF